MEWRLARLDLVVGMVLSNRPAELDSAGGFPVDDLQVSHLNSTGQQKCQFHKGSVVERNESVVCSESGIK